jgi:hypothetical protein
LDGDENKCKGECSEIYPIQNEHIKQRVGIIGSKSQFCAAFYHVHEWSNREHFCLDEDSCIIAKRTKKDVMEFAQEAEKFAEEVKNLDEKLANEFQEEAKQFAAKKLNISAREGKEFVEKTKKFAMKAPKSFDERAKNAVEKQNKAKKATNKQKKAKKLAEEAKQLAEEAQQLTKEAERVAEEAKQLVEKAEKATYAWCFQAKTVVAVVKFEKDGNILYEARYTNCGKEQKHAEDFFKEDMEKGELGEKVKANPNGTITLYLTLQPCNKSTGKTANTNSNQSCCTTLKNIYESKLQEHTISLYVKAANTCRLTVKREDAEDAKNAKENVDEEIDEVKDSKDEKDEKRRKNAVRGIKRLMRIDGVNVNGMTKDDWDYLLDMTNPDVPREYHARRQHLDESVQKTFTDIKAQTKKQ